MKLMRSSPLTQSQQAISSPRHPVENAQAVPGAAARHLGAVGGRLDLLTRSTGAAQASAAAEGLPSTALSSDTSRSAALSDASALPSVSRFLRATQQARSGPSCVSNDPGVWAQKQQQPRRLHRMAGQRMQPSLRSKGREASYDNSARMATALHQMQGLWVSRGKSREDFKNAPVPGGAVGVAALRSGLQLLLQRRYLRRRLVPRLTEKWIWIVALLKLLGRCE